MSPEEIIEAYNVVAQDVQNQAAQDAAIIGNSQRSLGPLAAAVASPSGQTSGLANYTYNRLMRPALDTTTTGLITQGKAQAMQTDLTNRLLEAKQRYEDAKNAYTVASTTPRTTGDGANLYQEEDDSTGGTRRKDESSESPEPNQSEQTAAVNSAVSNLNAYAGLTGGGQLKEIPNATKFSYTLNGSTHTGYVFPGQGGTIDGADFTKSGLNQYLNDKIRRGATLQNYLGNDVNYSLWKISMKISD